MINIRQSEIEILDILIKNKTVTLKELSKQLNLSDKTIRSILNNIKNGIDRDVATIESKQRIGYTLTIYDEDKFNQLVNEYKEDVDFNPTSPKERVDYIVDELIRFSQVNILDLAADLNVSDRQLRNDLIKVEEYLKKYNLKLENNRGVVTISGKEADIRLCFANVNQANINTIKITVKDVVTYYLNKYDIKISDLSYDNLINHIAVSVLRIKSNKYISYPVINDVIDNTKEFKVANEIANTLANKFKLVYSLYEIEYIALHIMGKEIVTKNSNFVVGDKIDDLVSEIFSLVKTTFNEDFSHNFDLRLALCLHFEPMIKRLKYNMVLENPLLNQIKEKYAYAYTIALTASSVITKKYNKRLSEDEIGYIALSFQLALEEQRKINIDKKRIILICNLGRVSANLIKRRYEQQFSNYIESIDTCGINDLDFINLNNYNFAFTTIPITKKLPIPIIEIQYFNDDQDNQEIKNALENEDKFNFGQYFNKQCFMVSDLDNKTDVIKTLCDSLSTTYNIKDDLLSSVLERESMAATDLVCNTAMPHTSHLISDKSHVAVMILDKPILWTNIEVSLIFLIAVGKDKEDAKKFYSLIAKFLLNEKMVNRLIKNRDYEDFLAMMKQIMEE